VASRTLRPLSIGEILDAGIKVVVRHWKVLAICVVVLVGPMNVIQVLLRASIDPNAFETGDATTTTDDFGPALVGLLGSVVLSGLAFLVSFTACFKAVADAWLGASPAVGRSLRLGARRLGAVLVAWIVWIVLLVIGLVLLIAPGVYLGVILCLTLPALLFEGIGPFRALGRSRSLVKGRWWPTLGLLLVGYLLVSIIGAIIQAILIGIAGASGSSVVPAAIATVIGSTISNAITTPYLAAVLTILYFDMRVRKEGFDLQLMAEDLGQPHDPDAPLPAPLVGEDLTPEQKAAAPYWPPPPGWTPPPVHPEPAHASWQPPSAGGTLWGSSSGPPAAPPAESPRADEDERATREPPSPEPDRDRDRDRADWLPPEAPRGPGGL
jgi:hypothetical protein